MTKAYLFVAAAAAAAIGAVTTAPAFARDARPADAVPTEASRPATNVPAVAQPRQRYCVVETITGSYIPLRTCHTRAAWLIEGFDPLTR